MTVSEFQQPVSRPSAPEVPRRSSWSLKLAAWSWGLSGVLLVLVPVAAVLMLRAQYLGLLRNAERTSDLLDFVNGSGLLDTTDVITAEQLRETLMTIDQAFSVTPVWVVVVLALLYALVAAITLVLYLLIARCTARAQQWARITGTILAVLSALAILQLWAFFAALAWLPINALLTNHVGLVVIGLQIAGIVFVWLPASNRAVRARAQDLRAQAIHFRTVAAQQVQQPYPPSYQGPPAGPPSPR
ncbi:hypothetical protein [Leucobacter sp. GX24907]